MARLRILPAAILNDKMSIRRFKHKRLWYFNELVLVAFRSRLQTPHGEDAVISLYVVKEVLQQKVKAPFTFAEFHPLADMDDITPNVPSCLGFETHTYSINGDVMTAVRSTGG